MGQSLQTNMLIMKLSEIADYCNNIETLLKRDIESFKQNNIREFILNSENQILEIEKIAGVIESIKSSYRSNSNDDVASIIQAHTRNLDKSTQHEIKDLLKQISEKALSCYNLIATNNQIIFTNTQQLQSLFTSIIQSQSEVNQLYNENGKMGPGK